MRLICIMPVRSEDWIIGLSARAVLRWCDELIVLNHASIDRTPYVLGELATEFHGRVRWFTRNEEQWPEMEHRQQLLELARSRCATHIATIDADEVPTANLVPDIREMFERCPPGATLQLPWQCLRGSITQVHQSGVWASQFASSGFVDEPAFHWSSAERGGYQYHHRHPMGKPLLPYRPCGFSRGGLMHLQFVDDARLRAKQYLYCLNERLRWPGRMTPQQVVDYYSPAVYGRWKGDASPMTLAEVPHEWWHGYEDIAGHLNIDSPAWQLEACRQIVRENPGIEAGLDSFGLEIKAELKK